MELGTPRKLKSPAPDHAGAAGPSTSSSPAAAAPLAPPSIKLHPSSLRAIFSASAGLAEHVVRHAPHARLTITRRAGPANARLAALANGLTLACKRRVPSISALGAAALARATRLELNLLEPTRVALAVLAGQLTSLREVQLSHCNLQLLAEDPVNVPVPLPPSVRSLELLHCGPGGPHHAEATFAAALSLLQSPGELRYLDTTASAPLVAASLPTLPRLTHLTMRVETRAVALRPLMDHAGLSHVTLHGPLDVSDAPRQHALREGGQRWRRLELVDAHLDLLAQLPPLKVCVVC